MTGIETASLISAIFSGSDMRATPPCARMSAGTRSSAITATAPASWAIRACSASTTSMITPPLSISARPVFTRSVPTSAIAPIVDGALALRRAARVAGHQPVEDRVRPGVGFAVVPAQPAPLPLDVGRHAWPDHGHAEAGSGRRGPQLGVRISGAGPPRDEAVAEGAGRAVQEDARLAGPPGTVCRVEGVD